MRKRLFLTYFTRALQTGKSEIMRQLLPIFISVLAVSTLGSIAKTVANPIPNLSPIAQKLNCNNPQTQAEITQCAGLSLQNADKKLNQVYKQLLPKLPKSRQQKLITAQQAWIKFRDSSCEFERSAFEGGTIAPSIYAGCLEQLTKQRTQQLQEYLKSDL
ncbi:MAG TPA: lysozyme inhibitor LprI family protein [Nostocaceae cyanobacterium]|nr:lysozyme inhibitor LprI family protein [Nostocaceae cyanobacterium]